MVIALPHPLHVPVGLEALSAGRHVLMQKPLCDQMESADRFVDARRPAGAPCSACRTSRAPSTPARDQVAGGAIGALSGAHAQQPRGPEVYYAEVRDAFGETSDDLWFFDASRASVGALFDMGVYATSQLIATAGAVARVYGRRPPWPSRRPWRTRPPSCWISRTGPWGRWRRPGVTRPAPASCTCTGRGAS